MCKKLDKAHVCLFWLSDDYKDITDIKGEVEFSESDLGNGDDLEPVGEHLTYDKKSLGKNRGRVQIINGELGLYVGEGCSDVIAETFKEDLCLNGYDIPIYHDKHWDAVIAVMDEIIGTLKDIADGFRDVYLALLELTEPLLNKSHKRFLLESGGIIKLWQKFDFC